MVNCGYCKEEIDAKTAKFDKARGVYLHDGNSLADVDRNARESGFSQGALGFQIPTASSAEGIEYQRGRPHNDRFCAQLYKLQTTMAGEIVLLEVADL